MRKNSSDAVDQFLSCLHKITTRSIDQSIYLPEIQRGDWTGVNQVTKEGCNATSANS